MEIRQTLLWIIEFVGSAVFLGLALYALAIPFTESFKKFFNWLDKKLFR